MPTESLQLTETLPAPPERVWRAWLDSKEHTEMTGGAETSIQPAVGATFQASDGYIVGMNVELEPYRRIVQTWRTTEFPPGAPHSKVEILLDREGEGTRLTLNHTDIPEGQAEQYREGWRDYYFTPMKDYFVAHANHALPVQPSLFDAPAERASAPAPEAKSAPKKAPARKAAPKKAASSKAKPKSKPATRKKAGATQKVQARASKAAKKPAAKKAPRKSAAKKPAAKKRS